MEFLKTPPTFFEVLGKNTHREIQQVNEFELAFANYCETKFSRGVATGCDALLWAMEGLGIGKGDEVITNGGIAGKISKVTEDFISIEVSENVEIKVQKVAIASALPKGTLKNI